MRKCQPLQVILLEDVAQNGHKICNIYHQVSIEESSCQVHLRLRNYQQHKQVKKVYTVMMRQYWRFSSLCCDTPKIICNIEAKLYYKPGNWFKLDSSINPLQLRAQRCDPWLEEIQTWESGPWKHPSQQERAPQTDVQPQIQKWRHPGKDRPQGIVKNTQLISTQQNEEIILIPRIQVHMATHSYSFYRINTFHIL